MLHQRNDGPARRAAARRMPRPAIPMEPCIACDDGNNVVRLTHLTLALIAGYGPPMPDSKSGIYCAATEAFLPPACAARARTLGRDDERTFRCRPPTELTKKRRRVTGAVWQTRQCGFPPQYICCPPLIDIVDPVTKPASSAIRNNTPRAISSALPKRPTGIFATIFSSTFGGTAATMSVSM